MSKLLVVFMICLLLGVLMSAAMAKPAPLSDHQMSAVVAGDEAEVADTSQGVASEDTSGNLAGIGGSGKAVVDNSTDNSVAPDESFNTDNSDNSILKDLDANVTANSTETVKSNNTDNSVDTDKSYNTDNSDNSLLKDLNANVAVDASDTEKSNNTDNSTENAGNTGNLATKGGEIDNSTEVKNSNNPDSSTENAGNTGNLAAKGGEIDNSVEVKNSNNTDNSTENAGNTGNLAAKGGEIDNSVENTTINKTENKTIDSYNTDNSVDNSITVKDGVYVTGLQDASGINLIIADGKVNAGSNILAVASVNSGAGPVGNVDAQVNDAVITQSVMNSSFIIINGGLPIDGSGPQ